ncbi:hypothetical protein F4604DRAFT_1918647 [Suillus subluteus]|nr:hypothetical protein F4604DRAFT_1918647 [Suillus subluteus]
MTSSNTVVVFANTNPGGMLMIRQVIQDFPHAAVSAVLSLVPVNFRVRPYGVHCDEILDRIGGDSRRAKLPLAGDTSWIDHLDEWTKEFFEPDADLSHASVRDDTILRMQVCALGCAAIFAEADIPIGRCKLYWDPDSLNRTDLVLRHAFRAPDFTYYFSKDDHALYSQIIVSDLSADERRTEIRKLCSRYVERMLDYLQITEIGQVLHSLGDLVCDHNKCKIESNLIARSQMTELLVYTKRVCGIARVFVQGGYIGTKSASLWPNSYNFQRDMVSTKEFFKYTKSNGIPVTILPTECVKNSPLELTGRELASLLQNSPMLLRMMRLWQQDTGEVPNWRIYEWLMAMMAVNYLAGLSHDMAIRRVKLSIGQVASGVEVLEFQEGGDGGYEMFWSDQAALRMIKKQFVKQMVLD